MSHGSSFELTFLGKRSGTVCGRGFPTLEHGARNAVFYGSCGQSVCTLKLDVFNLKSVTFS